VITLLIASILFGAVVAGLTGIEVLFWIAAGAFCVCGLPFALLSSFVHGEVSYAQDRADYREVLSEIHAEELADEHESAEDARLGALVKTMKKIRRGDTYNDNRQVHIHTRSKYAAKKVIR
jgi:hypothetical protein